MRSKRRFMHGKRLRRSPMKKNTYTGKGTIGEKLATDYADKFTTVKGALSEVFPLGKAKRTIKAIKGIYDATKKKA